MSVLSFSAIQFPLSIRAPRSYDEITTPPISPRTPSPMAPRATANPVAASPAVSPVHRNTYLAEYCYECDHEFNFLRRDEYVLNDHAFCSRRCLNRFLNSLCDLCERHPCACEDDASTVDSVAEEDEEEEEDYETRINYEQLPVNLAFIDFDHEDYDDEEQEQEYENYNEDDCEDPDDQIAPWRP